MARKLESKPGASSVPAFSATEEMVDKLVFKFEDVVAISAHNVDPEFATRGKIIYFFLNNFICYNISILIHYIACRTFKF